MQVIVGKSESDTNQDWELYYGAKRTSYNTRGGVHENGGNPFRKNYAGIGDTYDAERDAFYSPQPYASWTLDEETCLWEAPTARPDDDKIYNWDEDTTSWVEVE